MYKSNAQRRFFHTDTAKEKGITPEQVMEFDKASKAMKLPEHIDDKAKKFQRIRKFMNDGGKKYGV